MVISNLDDAGHWLEQAEAIVEMVAVALDDHGGTGTALVSSLYGAISLVHRAREVAEATNERLAKGVR